MNCLIAPTKLKPVRPSVHMYPSKQMTTKMMSFTVPCTVPCTMPSGMPYNVTINITVKPKLKESEKRSIYIGNISRFATREQIHRAIEHIVGAYGDLDDIRIPVHLESGRPLCYAFAIFKSGADASKFMAYAAPELGGLGDLRRALDIEFMGVRDPKATVTVGYAKLQ